MTFEIDHRPDAAYHLFQFEAEGGGALLERVDHSLKIMDGVLRHRIIRLKDGSPPPPMPAPDRRGGWGEHDDAAGHPDAPPAPAADAAPAEAAAPAAETAAPAETAAADAPASDAAVQEPAAPAGDAASGAEPPAEAEAAPVAAGDDEAPSGPTAA
jgi:hypothetical protein